MDLKRGDCLEKFSWHTKSRRTKYRYRLDPVPGVHCYKRLLGDYHKRPKTRQEIRCNEGIKDLEREYAFKLVRFRRNKSNLPTAWDDIVKGEVGSRSWKTSGKKRKQYE